jgi:hypothetical protein
VQNVKGGVVVVQVTDAVDGEQVVSRLASFSDMKTTPGSNNVHLVFLQQNNDDLSPASNTMDGVKAPYKSSFQTSRTNGSEKKTTTFAVLPNTTTWQQQSCNVNNTSLQDVPSSVPGIIKQ